MNIAIDVRSLMEGRHSGVEEYTTQLIRALLRRDDEHTYHLFYNSFRDVTLPSFTGRVVFHRYQFPNKVFNASQFFGWPRWDSLIDADVFFVPNMRLLPLAAGTPLVVTAHDLAFARFPHFYSWHRRLWHRAMRPRQLMRRADTVIAVSHATADDVISHFDVAPSHVQVVHSGCAPVPRPDAIAQKDVRQRLQLPKKFILFLGTLEPRKNVGAIVRSFSELANDIPHDLVIAGSSGWLMQAVQREIDQSPYRDRIHRIGFVSPEDKAPLLAASDVFVYPSFYEGFGFPPLEALAAGTPVITSAHSSLPEVVGEWAVLVNPYDVSELAVTLRSVVEAPPPVPAASEIYQRFSWDVAAAQTLDVLERAAAQG